MALGEAIMTALLEDDMSGYELARSFDTSLGLFWQASHQQIYRELARLQKAGRVQGSRVTQQGRPDKIVYTLTDAGREALDTWVYGTSRWRESKDDLLVKLYNLGEDNASRLAQEITARRELIMERLYLYERIRRRHYDRPEDLPVRRKGVYLALLAGLMQGEQILKWCDAALEMLSNTQREE